ncbi:venom protease [Stomoxys calcitrans]|uniref:venom protease n=1 Tax=Stomoxys calcitrans TaxID=35570 RepID=UPI0027E262A0|nr:venom protease [Stomoxys calcitrans]
MSAVSLTNFLCFSLTVLQLLTPIVAIGEECALNTECVHLRKCPFIKSRIHQMPRKPYCNLNQRGTYVCCPVEPKPYVDSKDQERRVVKECKSYQNVRKCDQSFIVGGEKADPKEFPFMALLIYQRGGESPSYICGGSLISSKFVLSAAHCFYQPRNPNIIRLGELDYGRTDDDASPVNIAIKKYTNHEGYNHLGDKFHDIAVVELEREVQFNDYIMPICLPLVDGRAFTQFLAAGWGAVKDFGESSSHLLKVKLDIFDDNECLGHIDTDADQAINTTIQMCAGSHHYARDTCTGDSGGPLFVDHPDYNCLHLILGVTSFSHGGCANIGYPAFYGRISEYVDWIEKLVWG